ncbi:PREDICTED: Golgi-associated plant pathogenesis-related protein 1-like [Drosophila arizonae]|uniref:Golgi-associated plant pathogenesis-related protein 1-like n=1 Tax=Drosophila arizonae TaxID=7263 RepID=A0ABM1NS02_DROAR|nr:PREDICTED: Golgi-associated plant pathogenesis-related protein 1-like [Drosophila arizonae]
MRSSEFLLYLLLMMPVLANGWGYRRHRQRQTEQKPTIVTAVDFDDFESEQLFWHNYLRKEFDGPELKLDRSLSDDCTAYAKTLVANKGKDTYNESADYGQIVHKSMFPEHCSLEWTKLRRKYFTGQLKPYEKSIFTQMVWKNSSTFGIGAAKREDHHYYVVLRYKPRGNIANHYNENVPRKMVGRASSRSINHLTFFLALVLLHLCGREERDY